MLNLYRGLHDPLQVVINYKNIWSFCTKKSYLFSYN